MASVAYLFAACLVLTLTILVARVGRFMDTSIPSSSVLCLPQLFFKRHLIAYFTRFAVPVTTSSANSAQFPAHSPVLPQPPLSIRLSPPGLTTVVLFIL